MLLPVAAALSDCKQPRCCQSQPRRLPSFPQMLCCCAQCRQHSCGVRLKSVPTWSNTSEVEATTLRPKAPKRLPMVLTR